MHWSEISEGRFERPFDPIEAFYRLFVQTPKDVSSHREFWLVTAVAKIVIHNEHIDTVSALRDAWKTMRYDHPDLACTGEGSQKIYEIPSGGKWSEWLAKTFVVLPSTTSDDLLALPKPFHTATCYWLPQTSEIALIAPHWMIDGLGALQLLNNFLNALVNPRVVEFGKEGINLSRDFFDAAEIPTQDATAEQKDVAARLHSTMTNNFPSLGLPPALETREPHSTRRLVRHISPDATGALITACKDRSISLTAATHCAAAVSVHKLSKASTSSNSDQLKKYLAFYIFNLRHHTRPQTMSPTNPVTNYHGAFPAAIDPRMPFLDNAQEATKVYKTRWDEPYYGFTDEAKDNKASTAPTLLECLPTYLRVLTDALSQPPPPGTPEPTHPTFSSIGQIDKRVSHNYTSSNNNNNSDQKPISISVDDVWIATEVAAGNKQGVIHTWTWKDKMYVSVCYDAAWFGEGLMAELLEGILRTLGKELQVGFEENGAEGWGLKG